MYKNGPAPGITRRKDISSSERRRGSAHPGSPGESLLDAVADAVTEIRGETAYAYEDLARVFDAMSAEDA